MRIPKFIPYDYDQTSMVVIYFKDQLHPCMFEYLIHYLVDVTVQNSEKSLGDDQLAI